MPKTTLEQALFQGPPVRGFFRPQTFVNNDVCLKKCTPYGVRGSGAVSGPPLGRAGRPLPGHVCLQTFGRERTPTMIQSLLQREARSLCPGMLPCPLVASVVCPPQEPLVVVDLDLVSSWTDGRPGELTHGFVQTRAADGELPLLCQA